MTLEFDPRTGFSQREDKIGELLIPRRNGMSQPIVMETQSNKKNNPVTQLVGMAFDDLYADWERYSLECPPGLVLVPGECGWGQGNFGRGFGRLCGT